MKAMMLWGLNEPLKMTDWDWGMDLKDEEVEVELKASALNHRDIWIQKGLYAGIVFPTILGSDGSGILNEKEVIINPSLFWGNSERVQSSAFQVLGMPIHGTMAEKIRIRSEFVHSKPAHLSFEEAAALPLAGLTAFRALIKRGQANKGDKVLVNGVGGGVATLVFQLSIALGCETWVTSSADWKLREALKMGASGTANYTEKHWAKALKKESGGFDVLIDSAAGDGFKDLADLANPGGRIVIYGGTRGKIQNLSPQKIFWKQLSIMGSTMGSDSDFQEMLQFVRHHKFIPRVDKVFPIEEANIALEKLASGEQFGKIVLRNG